ncbi:hypothetical protein [Geodermatophilus chilensis]|uniref:hypothetical protein n=1 Tax=Geodermatophilus chilensis TaxID=2035835 RepID=UPI000C268B62|nr:hypothetical protein [Geodermatophilus chilensis]
MTGQPDDGPLDGFATWQEQTAALEDMAKAAGLDGEPCGCRSAYVHDHGCTKFARAAVPVGDGAPGDELRERIARTICESDGVDWNHYLTGELDLHSDYRANAGALLSGPLAPTLAALDRVRALHHDGADYDACASCSFGLTDDCPTVRALGGDT